MKYRDTFYYVQADFILLIFLVDSASSTCRKGARVRTAMIADGDLLSSSAGLTVEHTRPALQQTSQRHTKATRMSKVWPTSALHAPPRPRKCASTSSANSSGQYAMPAQPAGRAVSQECTAERC